MKKDVSPEVHGSADHLSNVSTALASKQFEHCVCQDGWAGLKCEYEATACDGGAYHCFHGGECSNGGDGQKCNCTTATSAILGSKTFGGELCQHPATDICTEQGTELEYSPAKGLLFCVNYGKCNAYVGGGQP